MSIKRYLLECIVVFVIAVVGLVLFYFFNGYIYQQKQSNDQIPQPYRATLSGKYICLPDSEIRSEDGCLYGLETKEGELYTINFYLMSQTPPTVTVGDMIRGNGVVTPPETLSLDYYRKHGISGVFSVTDSLEKL